MKPRPAPPPGFEEQRHPALLRLAHWAMALAVLTLIFSGWRIYDSSPIFPFRIPEAITLGGGIQAQLAWHNDPGVATAIAWHFAAMWLLAGAYLTFLLYGVFSGHFRRDFLPLTPRSFLADFVAALRFRLGHKLGEYNAVQKLFYWGVIGLVALMLTSGIAIWKPVQTAPLVSLFGGFQGARLVHFLGMSGLFAFLLVHVALVLLVPRTLQSMILGRARMRIHSASGAKE
ncbi:MAG: cytochrome b/b6 domain-containing protein [Rhodospirillales bacterium]|nr:cytochrome b/b6 domain-containing protein [Rhodospirillales bacterium]